MSANLPACWSDDQREREQDAADHYCAQAFDELRREMVEAMTAGVAAAVVQAPAFGERRDWTLAEVVTDDMADPESRALSEMLAIVGRLARSGDAQALGLVTQMAERHAYLHQSERADEMRDEADSQFDEPWGDE